MNTIVSMDEGSKTLRESEESPWGHSREGESPREGGGDFELPWWAPRGWFVLEGEGD
ncbi:MAG: hypothetical protein ACYTHM_20375 [Planctomycetota bacterium]|jgi:hypothetical protein